MVQECDYAYEGEGHAVTTYARLTAGAGDRVTVSGRHEIDSHGTFVDPIVERSVTSVVDVATGTFHVIGQRPPMWLIADPALPDLDNDGWNETLFLGAGAEDYWCAGQDGDDGTCCTWKRTAFLGSSRDGRALSSAIYYAGSEISPEDRRRGTEYWEANFSCDPTPGYSSYDAPRSFTAIRDSAASLVRFTASRAVRDCVGLSDTACASAPRGVSHLDFTVPTPNAWRTSMFEGRTVFWGVEAANTTMRLRESLTPGSVYFTSGAPVLIADVTEHISRVFVRYSTGTGGNNGLLAVERPDGSLDILPQVLDHAAEVRNLSPGRHRFFWLSSEEREQDRVFLAFRSDLPPDGSRDPSVRVPEEANGVVVPGLVAAEPLAAATIQRTVTENRGSLQTCYERLLRERPQAAAIQITVTLAIGPTGSVTSAIAAQDGAPPELTACIEHAARQWRFPTSSNGGATRFPVVFSVEPSQGAGSEKVGSMFTTLATPNSVRFYPTVGAR